MRNQIFQAVASLLLLVALVFAVLATVSTPVASSLKLASTDDFDYGIFGYCGSSSCPKASYPYSPGDVDSDADWLFATSTRNTLAKVFIVAPIAAGIALLALIATVVSIFSAVPVVKIFSIIFTVLAAVANILVAVIVVIVFHPHVAWLGWLLIAGAGCCLLALPFTFFSIAVGDSDEKDADSYSQNLTDLDPAPGLGSVGPPRNMYGYQTDGTSSNQEYGYRGPGSFTSPMNKNGSNSSLMDSKPSLADDLTRPSTNTGNYSTASKQSMYAGMNLKNGPNSSVASKQHMAPNLYARSGTASSTGAGNAPYPPTERGSTILNSVNYGVFDHHPEVEGHRPFTELDDQDDVVERNSLPSQRDLESDEESDFTSVSQRPPNEMYNAPQQNSQPGYHGYTPQNARPQYANEGYNQGYQQSFVPQQPQSYSQTGYSAHHPPQHGYTAAPASPQMGPPQQPYMRQQAPRVAQRPSVSDNVLNNNPDFAIGFNSKRKQAPFGARSNGNARPGFTRPGQRDGPYGNF